MISQSPGKCPICGMALEQNVAEDIAFEKAVRGLRSQLFIKQEGNVAWTTATTQSAGTLNGREVNSAGVELMVLTKTEHGWRIRAIHWSSHRAV